MYHFSDFPATLSKPNNCPVHNNHGLFAWADVAKAGGVPTGEGDYRFGTDGTEYVGMRVEDGCGVR